MSFGNEKNIFEDLLSSVLSQFKKYHPSENLKFDLLGIFQFGPKINAKFVLLK